MKKILLFVFIFIFLFGCQKRMVLRKKVVVKAPFEDIEEGNYEITVYKIKYPNELEKKQEFYREMNSVFKRFYLEEKKAVIMLDMEYFEDFEYLRKNNILKEEVIFDKVASTLTEEEIIKLKEVSQVEVDEYKGTTQEYLNLQVAYLMKYLGIQDEFDANYIYTEREKNKYLDIIKNERKDIVKFLEVLKIDILAVVDNPYKEDKINLYSYWDVKNIELSKKNIISNYLNNYSLPLYIENIQEDDIEKIINNDIFIDNTLLIIKNSKYKGYVHRDKYIFFVGGDIEKREYSAYGINIKFDAIELSELIFIDEEVVLSDFTGRMKNGL
jgi:hypothetical protein